MQRSIIAARRSGAMSFVGTTSTAISGVSTGMSPPRTACGRPRYCRPRADRHPWPVTSSFDAVDVDVLRRRRTVKWRLYGDDVLAAWVAEMDFDVAPVVRSAIVDAVDREDFGYVEPDLSELATAGAVFFADRFGWEVKSTRVFPIADVLRGIWAALDVFAP